MLLHLVGFFLYELYYDARIQKKKKMNKFISATLNWGSHSRPLHLTLSNSIFLPTAYSPALIYFGRKRGWWITCKYPTVLKEKNIEKQKEYNLRYLLAKVRTT
jgi:hypothetical protein